MSLLFEELDHCPTPTGAPSLRRRRELRPCVDVFEIMLGQDFLMTLLFTGSEVALARLGVGACANCDLHVVTGGLGLEYTAEAVLDNQDVTDLIVVDDLVPVIEWHQTDILPIGTCLADDTCCRIVSSDSFAMATGDTGFDLQVPGREFVSVLLDDRSSSFYHLEGLNAVTLYLKPSGVFGLWSNEREHPRFTDRLASIFAAARAEPVTFDNPLARRPLTQAVYLVRKGDA